MKKSTKPTYQEIIKKSKTKPIELKTGGFGPQDRFALSWDFDSNPADKRQRKPVFLYVPDIAQDEHFHIELKRSEVKKLATWLNEFMKETKPKKKKTSYK